LGYNAPLYNKAFFRDKSMLDWSKIKTVLLDMDGTLLDLHFDTYFWQHHLPKRYSEVTGISIAAAKDSLLSHYQKVNGTIDWYCLDYWAEQTQMPITELKREIQHLIKLREDADEFLVALRKSGREIVLVTNAHPESLSLKIERTQLDKYFDNLYSTHDFGVTKESQLLWQRLQQHHPFELTQTLFVDDSLPILKSAQRFGIRHLLAVANPDSHQVDNIISEFPAITDFGCLTKDILHNPI